MAHGFAAVLTCPAKQGSTGGPNMLKPSAPVSGPM